MMAWGIERIGAYVPEDSLDVCALGERLDANPQFVREKLGFASLRRKGSEEECSDLCVRAFNDLISNHKVDLSEVDCVVVVTQNADYGGIPHASAIVHQKLKLNASVACFDLSLGCSGYVQGLSVLSGFLAENGLRAGLLFTADPYSRVIDENDRDTVMLFGDAATCSLISRTPRYRMGKAAFLTDSQHSHAIRIPTRGGVLEMDGNLVFRFVAKQVPRQIRHCLQLNNCELDGIDTFLVHQGSKFIVDTLASSLCIPRNKIPFDASSVGNTVSSSLPLLLRKYVDCDVLPSPILLAGFGVGLSSAVNVLWSCQK
jgi:3-oxoacyl-[acyl-carrier-protein] synthase III